MPLCLSLQYRIAIDVGDDHGNIRPLEPAADGQLQTVELVETDVRDEKIGRDRLQQLVRLAIRRRRGHEISGLRQRGLGAAKQRHVGVDEDNQGRHRAPLLTVVVRQREPSRQEQVHARPHSGSSPHLHKCWQFHELPYC